MSDNSFPEHKDSQERKGAGFFMIGMASFAIGLILVVRKANQQE